MKIFLSASIEETQHVAEKFAHDVLERRRKRKGAFVVGLKGDLGSGKTTFVQGFARGLGIKEKVLSPTFVIIKKYKIKSASWRTKFQYLYHIDCYRLEDEKDMLELEWNTIVSEPHNLILVEWSERIEKILPEDTISISFEAPKEHIRKISFS